MESKGIRNIQRIFPGLGQREVHESPKVQMSFDKTQRNPSKKVFEFFYFTPFSEKPVSENRGVTDLPPLKESCPHDFQG